MGEDFLLVLSQLMLFAICLLILGEPLRRFLSNYVSLFKNLVPLQAGLLDVYLGGFIIYIIASIPLQIFSSTVAWLVLLFSGGFLVFLNRKRIWQIQGLKQIRDFRQVWLNSRSTILESGIVASLVLLNLGLQLFAVRNFIFGSIHDASLHALFVEVILENRQIPATLQPYMPEGIVYPQAPHAIFAYATYILGWDPGKSVLYVSNLFNAISILGAYYLGKRLWPESRLGLSLAFLFTFVSNWPLFITWGSNALVVGFPFFFAMLSLLPFFSKHEKESTLGEFATIGVLFGYLGALYLLLYEVVVVSAILTLILVVFRHRSHIRKKLGYFLVMFGVSILPMSVFVFRYIQFYIYPGVNPGAVSDLPRYRPAMIPVTDVLKWPFESQHPLLQSQLLLLFIISVAVTAVAFLTKRQNNGVKNVIRVAVPSFCAILILTFSTYLPISSIVPLEVGVIIELVVPICLIISVFNVKLGSALQRRKVRFSFAFLRIKPLTVVAISIFLVAYTPFLYYGVLQYPEKITSSYGLFAITTQDDYSLMVWMRDNMPKDVVILVNPDEAGSFIPAVSHLRVILPFTGNRRSPSYQKLTGLIQQQVLDSTVFELMKHFNITHVYVGAKSTYWWDRETKWDPDLFLQNRDRFELVHDIGNAYLFRVRY